ncbi:MAG: hypothetical protein ACKVGZ_10570, partial [Alphaproteobacteria bacterium]
SQASNTYFSDWVLNVASRSSLTKLVIDAGVGGTLFDIVRSPAETPISLGGRAFEDRSNLTGVIDVRYTTPVAIAGQAPLGDLFGVMTVNFMGVTGGGIDSSNSFLFNSDTDSIGVSSALVAAPIPGALPLILSGIIGFGLMGYRKAKKAA